MIRSPSSQAVALGRSVDKPLDKVESIGNDSAGLLVSSASKTNDDGSPIDENDEALSTQAVVALQKSYVDSKVPASVEMNDEEILGKILQVRRLETPPYAAAGPPNIVDDKEIMEKMLKVRNLTHRVASRRKDRKVARMDPRTTLSSLTKSEVSMTVKRRMHEHLCVINVDQAVRQQYNTVCDEKARQEEDFVAVIHEFEMLAAMEEDGTAEKLELEKLVESLRVENQTAQEQFDAILSDFRPPQIANQKNIVYLNPSGNQSELESIASKKNVYPSADTNPKLRREKDELAGNHTKQQNGFYSYIESKEKLLQEKDTDLVALVKQRDLTEMVIRRLQQQRALASQARKSIPDRQQKEKSEPMFQITSFKEERSALSKQLAAGMENLESTLQVREKERLEADERISELSQTDCLSRESMKQLEDDNIEKKKEVLSALSRIVELETIAEQANESITMLHIEKSKTQEAMIKTEHEKEKELEIARTKIRELESAISDSRANLAAALERFRAEKCQVEIVAEARITVLEETVTRLDRTVSELQIERDVLTDRLSHNESMKTQEELALKQTLTKLEETIHNLKASAAVAAQRLQQEKDQAHLRISELEEELKQLRLYVTLLQDERDSLRDDIAETERRKAREEALTCRKIAELEVSISKSKATLIAAMDQLLHEKMQAEDTAKMKISELDDANTRIQEAVALLQRENECFQKDAAESDRAKEDDLRAAKHKTTELELSVRKSKADLPALEREKNQAQTSSSELGGKITHQLHKTVARESQEQLRHIDDSSKFEDELREWRKMYGQLQDLNEANEARITDIQEEMLSITQNIEWLTTERNRLSNEVEDVNEHRAQDRQNAEVSMAKLEREMKSFQADNATLLKMNAEHFNTISKLKAEFVYQQKLLESDVEEPTQNTKKARRVQWRDRS